MEIFTSAFPDALQSQAIHRLRLLLEASDPGELIQVASSGRKNLQLMTRLQELALAAGPMAPTGWLCSTWLEESDKDKLNDFLLVLHVSN